jgi:hypothetical protein
MPSGSHRRAADAMQSANKASLSCDWPHSVSTPMSCASESSWSGERCRGELGPGPYEETGGREARRVEAAPGKAVA